MQRTEAEVVKRAFAMLEDGENNLDLLKDRNIAERVATKVLLDELRTVIAPFVTSQTEATQLGLKSLEDFLRKWNRLLLGTPLLYCYQPNHLISKSCIALAEDLSAIFPYTPLKLLLPKVIIPDNFKTQHYNDFVVTPDGYLIGVLDGLDAVKAKPDHRFLDPNGKDIDPDLLMEHSASAAAYATRVRNLVRPKAQDHSECDTLRAELKQYLDESVDYQRFKFAHKEAGQNKLMAMLTKKMQTPQQLAEFIDANLTKKEWPEFLRAVGHEELCRILIPKRGQTPQKKDQTDQAYKIEQATAALPAIYELVSNVFEWPSSDSAKRASVYMMTFLYNEMRQLAPEYTDKLGGWGGGYSRTHVLAQTKAMQDFLLGDENMLDLEKYLQKQVDEKKMLAINSPTCLSLKNKIIDAGRQCEQKFEDKPASVAALL